MKKIYLIFQIVLALYLGWYALFDSPELAMKIDTHIHYIRTLNWLETIKSLNFFPAWHDSPLWGYPEDYNYIGTYLFSILLSLILPIKFSIKFLFVGFLFLASLSSSRFLKNNFVASDFQAFIGSCMYMGGASFINFGLGSGSLTRVAAIAFFPWVINLFMQWFHTPDRKSQLQFVLGFYCSYLIHPNLALVSIVTILLFLSTQYKHLFPRLKSILTLAVMGLPLFSWQLGSLLLAREFISWDDMYAFYRSFKVHISPEAFFGFYLNTDEKAAIHYFGFFSFFTALMGAGYCLIKPIQKKAYPIIGLSFLLIGLFIIILGQPILERNTYRFDMLYWLGVSICTALFAAHIDKKPIAIIFMLAIIGEQTYFCRSYPGRDYVQESTLNIIKEATQNELKLPRALLSQSHPFVITSEQLKWVNKSYGLQSHGFHELSPYNLGKLQLEQEIPNRDRLHRFLGLAPISESSQLGMATEYEHYLEIHTKSRAHSYNKVYRELLMEADFSPEKMPMAFVASSEDSPTIKSPDGKFEVKLSEPNWKQMVFDYFKVNHFQEKLEWKTTPKKLIVLKEPFHPRKSLFADNFMKRPIIIEPGLIGYISDKQVQLKVKSAFTWWETVLGMISLGYFSYLLMSLRRFRQIRV